MAANVVEPAQNSIVPARYKQRLSLQLSREVISWTRHLMRVSHHLPGLREDLFFFERENFGIDIQRGRQRPSVRHITIDAKHIRQKNHIYVRNSHNQAALAFYGTGIQGRGIRE